MGPQGVTGANGSQGPTGPTGATGASPFTVTGSDAVYTAGSVGIGADPPAGNALLELASTDKGFLPPRMTTAQRTAITSPSNGLLVYDTDVKALHVYDASGTGDWKIQGAFTGTNVYSGVQAGNDNAAGTSNVFIGYQAGYSNNGNNNVFIGYQAGRDETGNSELYIDNSSTNSPLIWGDFSNNKIVINGNNSDNLNNRTFFVAGSAGGFGAWWNDSDVRLKTNISTIQDALNKVLALRGVNFEWKDSDSQEKGLRMGFIAQEAESVIPEVVNSEGDHYSMQYAAITALLVEAVKEQQMLIVSLQDENAAMKERIAEIDVLKEEFEKIRAVIEK